MHTAARSEPRRALHDATGHRRRLLAAHVQHPEKPQADGTWAITCK